MNKTKRKKENDGRDRKRGTQKKGRNEKDDKWEEIDGMGRENYRGKGVSGGWKGEGEGTDNQEIQS